MRFNSNKIDFEYYAVVTDIIEKKEATYVVTDRTDFYAEAGGQLSDRGSIGSATVIAVIEENGKVLHEVDPPGDLKVGDRVKCIIDKANRLEISRQHTGQHLLSAVLENDYGIKTTSFHMAEDMSTIDTDLPVTPLIREEVQTKVMDLIGANLTVESFVRRKDEIDRFGLRKLVEADGDIQIIRIGEIDYNACCGTHMESTGALKLFILKKVENYKGGSRVAFLFGDRALVEFNEAIGIVADVKSLLQVHESEIPFRVRLLIEREEEVRRQVSEMREKLADLMLTLPEYNQTFVYQQLDEEEELIKTLISRLSREEKTAVLVDLRELRLYAAATKADFNLGSFFKSMKTSKIRGGGGMNSLQAVFASEMEMLEFADHFSQALYEEILK